MQDEPQNTWDKVKEDTGEMQGGFGETIAPSDDNEALAPDDEQAISEDMTASESAMEIDEFGDEHVYTDEDQA